MAFARRNGTKEKKKKKSCQYALCRKCNFLRLTTRYTTAHTDLGYSATIPTRCSRTTLCHGYTATICYAMSGTDLQAPTPPGQNASEAERAAAGLLASVYGRNAAICGCNSAAVYGRNAAICGGNSEIYEAAICGGNSAAVYGGNAAVYGGNAAVYGGNAAVHGANAALARETTPPFMAAPQPFPADPYMWGGAEVGEEGPAERKTLFPSIEASVGVLRHTLHTPSTRVHGHPLRDAGTDAAVYGVGAAVYGGSAAVYGGSAAVYGSNTAAHAVHASA
eukprot:3940572-Rhodomonas_salina.1